MGQNIKKVTVVGTGILGTQIAMQAVHSGYHVTVYDADPDSFHRAHGDVGERLKNPGEKSLFTFSQWEAEAEKIQHFQDLKAAVKNADLVIEAVSENKDLKRKVFETIDKYAKPEAILATNSSSIPISRIENAVSRPEKCLNLHFYFPALGHNMVDLMGGTRTDPEVFEAGRKWIQSVGCVPLTVKKEILGFCFNRVWRAIKRETLHMWADGFVDFRDVDRAWMIFTDMPKGPFGLMDGVGLDVVYDIEIVYFNESQDPKDHPPKALKDKIERGELGLKAGKGFYTYPDPEYENPDFLKG